MIKHTAELLWKRKSQIIIWTAVITVILLLAQGMLEIKRNSNITRENSEATRSNTEATVKNTEATQQLVEDLADGLKSLTEDSERKLLILICMNKIPIEQRTTDRENACRKQADGFIDSVDSEGKDINTTPDPTKEQQKEEKKEDKKQDNPRPDPEPPVDQGLIPDNIPIIGRLL